MSLQLLDDKSIRTALRSRLSVKQTGDTTLLEELGVCRGQVRVDLALVNGAIHGYEIKSDRDSLRRLSGQIEVYSKVLDRVTLVVGSRHLDDALKMIPDWWGVLHISSTHSGIRFKHLRRAKKNPNRDIRAQVELLWLDDAMALLLNKKLDRGFRGKPRSIVWDHICKHIRTADIASAVRDNLKARATMTNYQ